jgi:hypothetical protein
MMLQGGGVGIVTVLAGYEETYVVIVVDEAVASNEPMI